VSAVIVGTKMFLMLATSNTRKGKNMEAINLAQEAIITQQREEIEALESLVIEYQEIISNLEKRVYNYGEPLMKEYKPYWRQP
jgi:predicted RNase H-like nuclease (RuvC/YqgF family)